jgi:hypothetical protein
LHEISESGEIAAWSAGAFCNLYLRRAILMPSESRRLFLPLALAATKNVSFRRVD